MPILVEYDRDLGAVIETLGGVAKSYPGVLTQPAPEVSVVSFLENRITVALRCWVDRTQFETVRSGLGPRRQTGAPVSPSIPQA